MNKTTTNYVFKSSTKTFETKPESPGSFYVWNVATATWVYDLELAKVQKWEDIKNTRRLKEVGGFSYAGNVYDSDLNSQAKIQGAVLLANNVGSTFSIDWTLMNNTIITLNQQDMIAVGIAMGTFMNSIYETARSLRVQIDAATTQAELDAIVWPNA